MLQHHEHRQLTLQKGADAGLQEQTWAAIIADCLVSSVGRTHLDSTCLHEFGWLAKAQVLATEVDNIALDQCENNNGNERQRQCFHCTRNARFNKLAQIEIALQIREAGQALFAKTCSPVHLLQSRLRFEMPESLAGAMMLCTARNQYFGRRL